MRRYSVVIPTMRRPDTLRETLQSVLECDPPAFEIFIIDADPAASARLVVEEVAKRPGAPRFEYRQAAPSLTHQRNIGIDAARGDVVVFLDDDVAVPTILFERLDSAYDESDVVGATGKVVEGADERLGNPRSRLRRLLFGRGDGRFTAFGYPRRIVHAETPRDIEHMLGCFMSARREAAKVVRFDEALGGYALAEDEDFSFRLSRRGRIVYLPDVVVLHHMFGFSSARDTREFGRLVVRNRAYLFEKNFPQTIRARLGFAGLLAMLVGHRLVNRQWDGARGVVDGALELWRRRV